MAECNMKQMQRSLRVFDNSSREIKCKAAWHWLNMFNKLGMKQALVNEEDVAEAYIILYSEGLKDQ